MKWYEQPELTTLTDDCKILIWDFVTQSSRTVDLSILKTFLSASSTNTTNTKELTYSFDGDSNGLCYFVGTQKGTVAWQNPHYNGLVMSASAVEYGHVELLVDQQASEFYTPTVENSWIKLALSNGSLKCKHYLIRNRTNIDHYLRNWKLQGSNDGLTWTDLDVHTNNTTLNSPSQWLSLPVTTTNFYTQFRLIQTGLNSYNYNYLCIGEFELYGTYNY